MELTLLAKSNEVVEYGFEMYGCLLQYAQCFERNVFFKKEMGLGEDEEFRMDEEELGNQHYFNHNNPLQNPFKRDQPHIVEAALLRARKASDLCSRL